MLPQWGAPSVQIDPDSVELQGSCSGLYCYFLWIISEALLSNEYWNSRRNGGRWNANTVLSKPKGRACVTTKRRLPFMGNDIVWTYGKKTVRVQQKWLYPVILVTKGEVYAVTALVIKHMCAQAKWFICSISKWLLSGIDVKSEDAWDGYSERRFKYPRRDCVRRFSLRRRYSPYCNKCWSCRGEQKWFAHVVW